MAYQREASSERPAKVKRGYACDVNVAPSAVTDTIVLRPNTTATLFYSPYPTCVRGSSSLTTRHSTLRYRGFRLAIRKGY